MGCVGVSSINLIFAYCTGHCRSSFNPIEFIHSWLLIQGSGTIWQRLWGKGERGCISEALMRPRSKLTKHLGPLIRPCCASVCATKSIMNAGLPVVEEQGRTPPESLGHIHRGNN